MTSSLLSPVHIQKLGHPIEEIRTRALQSVLSKYNLDLVDDSNLENTKLLLQKLVEWFNFETHPYEDKVLKLILKIVNKENVSSIIKNMDYKKITMKLEKMKYNLDSKYFSLIQEITDCLKKADVCMLQSTAPIQYSFGDPPKRVLGDIASHKKNVTSLARTDNKLINCPRTAFPDSCVKEEELHKSSNEDIVGSCEQHNKFKNISNSIVVKIEYFPWQLLIVNDSELIMSVYDSLRYFDNVNSIQKSCQYYRDILLKDFPIEVFLQRTLLIQTFFELLRSESQNIQIPVLACLIATVKHLHNRFQFALDISVVCSREYFKDLEFLSLSNNYENKFEKEEWIKYADVQICSPENGYGMENEEAFQRKSDQYSVTKICFSILSEVIPLMAKKKSAKEYNLMFELILETFHLLAQNFTSMVWHSKDQIKQNLYQTFSLFHEPLKYLKKNNRLCHNIVIHIIINMLSLFKIPEENINEVLPHCIQLEFLDCVSDYIFILLFPNLNAKIMSFVEQFLGQRKKEILDNHEVSLQLCTSMKSAVEFLKHSKRIKTKIEKLEHAQKALSSLGFHKNFQFIQDFVSECLFKWSEHQLTVKEKEMRKNIFLKLISHNDEEIKNRMYKELHSYVIRNLGADIISKQKFQYPGNKFVFLFDSDILNEIICHGLNSPQIEVQTLSTEILIHVLKGKIFFPDDSWQKLINALIPCLPLLQSYADKSSALGRCILKMLDPDISRTILLPPLDLIRGNLRLLFCKNHLIREEALLRLFWLLAKEDPEKAKLPRLNLLRGINLSSICTSVSPEDYSNSRQSFYSVDSLCNVMEILTGETIEPSVRRSALTQLNVMLEDTHLQPIFLEQKGLSIIIDIFKNCLMEKEFQNYPDSVLPIMGILKLICLDNPSVRLQLSLDKDLYYCILRGLLLFNSERQSRQQGVELLCLLLYNECIINIKNERAIRWKISLPQVLIDKICLPFCTSTHWKCSKYMEAANRETLMLNEKSARLLRIYWNIEWLGGVSKVLALKSGDLKENIFSPSLPNDMKLKADDLESLRTCSITWGIRKTLYDIQNATTHEVVITTLFKLNSYLILNELEKCLEENENLNDMSEIQNELAKLDWENTLERFLVSNPSCEDDEILFCHVVKVVRLVLKTIKSESFFVWIEKLLTDEVGTLPNTLKSCGKQYSNLTRIDLTRVVTGLIKDIICRSTESLSNNWLFYINMVIRELKLSCKHESYNVAHVEWLMGLLVDVTGKSTKNIANSPQLYKDVITCLMEIIVALHCIKESHNSFLGMNIIKNCLYVLNHILTDTQSNVKDAEILKCDIQRLILFSSQGWERLWHDALSQVTGHNEQANYCWLLSMWFLRDPMVRALIIQLLAGFSTTCHSYQLLIEELYIEFEYIWSEGFKILFDDRECNLVKEKTALLLSNLVSLGSIKTANGFLQNLLEINFYGKVNEYFENVCLEPLLHEEINSHILKQYYGRSEAGNTPVISVSSTSVISGISTLLLNIIFLKPDTVAETIINSGLLVNLTKIFSEAPEACQKYINEDHVIDLIRMYSVCCKVITKCMRVNATAYVFVQQSQQFVSSLFCLFNYNLYGKNLKQIEQRNQLWCGILDIFSIILIEPEEMNIESELAQNEGFKALNYAITENGTDYFLSSLYLAVSSFSCDLRVKCLRFLTNLFGVEGNKQSSLSIADIFERNIFMDSVEQATIFSWKGFTICKKVDLNFGKRLSDILLQSLSLNNHIERSEFKILVPETLGTLLSICNNAKNYCVDKGLIEDIVENLRTAFIKLSLESVECLRKASDRKRIDPTLNDIETNYRLLGNLLTGCKIMKMRVAGAGLSSLVHKLWYWCTAKYALYIITLKLLITFTLNSEPACRSLAMDKTWNMSGIPKPLGLTTLLSTVMMHIEKEMDHNSKGQNNEILQLSFQLLENCCTATECRSLMAKGSFISSLKYFNTGFRNKRRPQSDCVIEALYNFLIIFTSYQEGQLGLAKNQEVLETIICSASSSSASHKRKALTILRNICFHQLNRVQLLSQYQFLSTLFECLKSGQSEEINLALHAIWGLICNSQKGKITMRNSGFEDLLKEVKKKLIVVNESLELSIVDNLFQILQNK